eukprot:5515-Heterococcus_DN1.PRE.2
MENNSTHWLIDKYQPSRDTPTLQQSLYTLVVRTTTITPTMSEDGATNMLSLCSTATQRMHNHVSSSNCIVQRNVTTPCDLLAVRQIAVCKQCH